MGKIKETIWKMEPHTEAKHVIFKKYLDAWLPILTKYQNRVVIIDGFAGPGEYIGGKDGSPIIAIKCATEHKLKINSEVKFLFIEKKPDRCDFLERKLKKIKLPNNVKYECVCDSFPTVVNDILNKLSKEGKKLAPTFVFIDPFGFKDIPFEVIKRLMECEKCEVLITFMFEEINRFIDDPKLERTYNSLFGTYEWKEVRVGKNPQERQKILHGVYEKQLKRIAKHIISFKMKNKMNKTDYFLFFATNNITGLKRMKSAMWKIDQKGSFQFSDAGFNPGQTTLFEIKPNYSQLKRIILEKYKGKSVDVEELEYFIVTETLFRETHFKRQILIPMEKEETIKVTGKRKKVFSYPPGTNIKFL